MIIKKVLASSKDYIRRTNDLVDYIQTAYTDDQEEKCLYHKGLNFLSEDSEIMKAELLALVASGKNKQSIEKNVIQHWVISWGEQETPAIEDIEQAAKRFLDEMGFKEHQAIIGVHINTENIHVHIAVSRIHPTKHTVESEWNDTIRSHAVLAGIERAMQADSSRNALFTYNLRKGGVVPNPHYKPKNSVSFAYASPETVVVEVPPDFVIPPLKSLNRRQDCWYYKGHPDTPGAILHEDKLYFFNWAYKDTINDIKELKKHDCKIIVQHDLAPVFFDKSLSVTDKKQFKKLLHDTDVDILVTPYDEKVYARKRPPAFPLNIRNLRRKHSPWNFYKKTKQHYERKNINPIKIHSMISLHMRAHGFMRRDIEESLRRDGLSTHYAKHITRWLYSSRGNMELFRQQAQKTIVMEKETKLKKLKKKISSKFRMSYDTYGNIQIGNKKTKKSDTRTCLDEDIRLKHQNVQYKDVFKETPQQDKVIYHAPIM